MPGPHEAEIAGPRHQGDVLEHGRQPDRGKDLNVVRSVDDAAHDQAVDHQTHDEEERDCHEHDEVGVGRVEIERPECEVHAEHQELAVGEVDHAHDPEDQGQPDRDEGVDPPEQDRRDREGDEDAYLR